MAAIALNALHMIRPTLKALPMNTPIPSPQVLDLSGLETVYDALAGAIDRAGPDKSEQFLVKLALLQAQAQGDARAFVQQVEIALADL